jgi:uncharacterized protein (DUF927 family)
MTDEPIQLDDARRQRKGKGKARDAILGAAPATAQATVAAEAEAGDKAARLEMTPAGLWFRSGERRPYLVSGRFDVLSETRDDDAQAWGLLLRFADRDGQMQHQVATRDMFSGEGTELAKLLSRRGLYVHPGRGSAAALNEYLAKIVSPKRARIVARTGWHRIEGVRVFVLPDETFGKPPVEVIYQAGLREPSPFVAAGTLDEWREGIAAQCSGNSRLMLAVCCGFAGPLLELAGEEGGGLHFRGASSVGKTTALRLAASVWGSGTTSDAGGFIRQWRATGNAIEGVARAHSDTLLPIDELGQADSREVGDMAYMLANGQGKARSDRDGGLRAPVRFRVLFLSTGELSLADKIAEVGRHVKAGQEIRLLDLPADAGAGLGLFEDLHDAASADAFAKVLRVAARRWHGTAGPAFLRYVVGRLGQDPEWPASLRKWADDLLREWLEPHPEAGGQVRSVARRFALLAIAGELATMADVTGWVPSAATEAMAACFGAWLGARGTTGAREDADAVVRVRAFIARYQGSRFADWRDRTATDDGRQSEPDEAPPAERFRIQDQAGWRRWVTEDGRRGWLFYFSRDGWHAALAGLDLRQANRALIERGLLIPAKSGDAQRAITVPGYPKKVKLYVVRGSILGASDGPGGDAGTAGDAEDDGGD